MQKHSGVAGLVSEGRPLYVNDAGFRAEVLESELPVVVEFWSPECIHCQRMANTVDALAEEFAGRVKVVKVNVLENPESARAFGVKDIPAFFYMNGGHVAARTTGAMSKGKLKGELGLDAAG